MEYRLLLNGRVGCRGFSETTLKDIICFEHSYIVAAHMNFKNVIGVSAPLL